MSNIQTQVGIQDYVVKAVNVNNSAGLGQYIDRNTIYQLYPKLKGSEMLEEVIAEANMLRPGLLDSKSDLFDFFNKRVVRKDTKNKDSIEVKVELPKTENFIEITKVLVGPEITTVGRNRTSWKMIVKSANLTPKNYYSLIYFPQIQFRPKTYGDPRGSLGHEYEFEVWGGHFEDHISLQKLRIGTRFQNMGAYREEAVKERGSIELQAGGKAYVCFKYPFTKMGFKVMVTDEAWRAGNHFIVEPEDMSDKTSPSFTFSSLDVKFKYGCENAMDRHLMFGTGFPKGEAYLLDGTTHYPAEIGPSVMDFVRASNIEQYYHRTKFIQILIDRAKRAITKMKIKDRQGLIIDVHTGDGGWDLLTPQLKEFDKNGIVEADWLYGQTEGLDTNRKGVILNRKQIRGIHMDDYGTMIFHNSDALNSGILSGQREVRKGLPLSSYWFIMTIGKQNEPTRPINNGIHLYENSQMEGFGVRVGTFTPSGHVMNTSVNYKSHADIGHAYEIIYDMEKAVYVPNINGLHWFVPDIAVRS